MPQSPATLVTHCGTSPGLSTSALCLQAQSWPLFSSCGYSSAGERGRISLGLQAPALQQLWMNWGGALLTQGHSVFICSCVLSSRAAPEPAVPQSAQLCVLLQHS